MVDVAIFNNFLSMIHCYTLPGWDNMVPTASPPACWWSIWWFPAGNTKICLFIFMPVTLPNKLTHLYGIFIAIHEVFQKTFEWFFFTFRIAITCQTHLFWFTFVLEIGTHDYLQLFPTFITPNPYPSHY